MSGNVVQNRVVVTPRTLVAAGSGKLGKWTSLFVWDHRGALLSVRQAAERKVQSAILLDPDVAIYAARVSVWFRWLCWLMALAFLAYRPHFWYPDDQFFLLLHPPLIIGNALLHYRLRRGRAITWHWLMALSALDIAVITGAIVIGGSFDLFIYTLYYPALALFAVMFTSVWLSLLWTSAIATTYAAVSFAVGLDFGAGEEQGLLGRIVAMYTLVCLMSLIGRFDRRRRLEASKRELQLRQERIDLSQEIHDTASQTAYLIRQGLFRATQLADESNYELQAALKATTELSNASVWELRHSIDQGKVFEGETLGDVLSTHAKTFEAVSSIKVTMSQDGHEPALSTQTRARLFSIAHNALTNTLRHAQATQAAISLTFGDGRIHLSISDDGNGLPSDFDMSGRGIRGMRADAQLLGGSLRIDSSANGVGTKVSCTVPVVSPGERVSHARA